MNITKKDIDKSLLKEVDIGIFKNSDRIITGVNHLIDIKPFPINTSKWLIMNNLDYQELFKNQIQDEELKKWIEFRKSKGEPVSGDSWLMRDIWNIQKFSRGLVTAPKKLRATGIKRLIERALKSQGIRNKLPPGKRRYEFQIKKKFLHSC